MNAHEMGTKWGESVSERVLEELLRRAFGKKSASDLKHALSEAERDLSENYVPFRIEDWPPVDEAWIKEFCNGVRSARTGAESGWVGDKGHS